MAKQYNFMDCTFFDKNNKSHDIYNISKECDLENISKNTKIGILDPNISTIEVKDIEKGS